MWVSGQLHVLATLSPVPTEYDGITEPKASVDTLEKVKFSLQQVMKAQRGSRGIDLLFL
jgi:hypothetical protein